MLGGVLLILTVMMTLRTHRTANSVYLVGCQRGVIPHACNRVPVGTVHVGEAGLACQMGIHTVAIAMKIINFHRRHVYWKTTVQIAKTRTRARTSPLGWSANALLGLQAACVLLQKWIGGVLGVIIGVQIQMLGLIISVVRVRNN